MTAWGMQLHAQIVNPDGKVFALSFLARGLYVRGSASFGDVNSSGNAGGIDGAAITPVNDKGSIVLEYQYNRNGDVSGTRVGGGLNVFTRPYSETTTNVNPDGVVGGARITLLGIFQRTTFGGFEDDAGGGLAGIGLPLHRYMTLEADYVFSRNEGVNANGFRGGIAFYTRDYEPGSPDSNADGRVGSLRMKPLLIFERSGAVDTWGLGLNLRIPVERRLSLDLEYQRATSKVGGIEATAQIARFGVVIYTQ